MNFLEEVKRLQKEENNIGRIVIVRCGVFLVWVGKDAIELNKIFNLKLTCIKPGVCKVGIPINAILKYTEQLENMKVSFIVYDYEKNKKLYTAKYMYTGEKITETRNCLECKTCKYCTKNYQNNNVDFFELLERKQLERGKQENE